MGLCQISMMELFLKNNTRLFLQRSSIMEVWEGPKSTLNTLWAHSIISIWIWILQYLRALLVEKSYFAQVWHFTKKASLSLLETTVRNFLMPCFGLVIAIKRNWLEQSWCTVTQSLYSKAAYFLCVQQGLFCCLAVSTSTSWYLKKCLRNLTEKGLLWVMASLLLRFAYRQQVKVIFSILMDTAFLSQNKKLS